MSNLSQNISQWLHFKHAVRTKNLVYRRLIEKYSLQPVFFIQRYLRRNWSWASPFPTK